MSCRKKPKTTEAHINKLPESSRRPTFTQNLTTKHKHELCTFFLPISWFLNIEFKIWLLKQIRNIHNYCTTWIVRVIHPSSIEVVKLCNAWPLKVFMIPLFDWKNLLWKESFIAVSFNLTNGITIYLEEVRFKIIFRRYFVSYVIVLITHKCAKNSPSIFFLFLDQSIKKCLNAWTEIRREVIKHYLFQTLGQFKLDRILSIAIYLYTCM